MLDGGVPELELGALLVALRMKGESPGELLGAYEALAARVHQLQPPRRRPRTVVIGTGEGTRSQPNLTPLVALVLRRMGVPVLVHGALEGHGRVAAAYVFRELGVLPCATLAQAQGRARSRPARVRADRGVCARARRAHRLCAAASACRTPRISSRGSSTRCPARACG